MEPWIDGAPHISEAEPSLAFALDQVKRGLGFCVQTLNSEGEVGQMGASDFCIRTLTHLWGFGLMRRPGLKNRTTRKA